MLRLIAFTISLATIFDSYGQNKEKLFHDGGIYNTIELPANESISVVPQIWTYVNNFYVEARYNYEDNKTASIYFGRAFSFDKKAEIEITPMVGVVFGKTHGISPGFNFELKYKRFSTFTQGQYTMDLKTFSNSYIWDWTGFSIDITKYFGLGGAVQVYHPNEGERLYRAGPMINLHHKSFVIETYVYNIWESYPICAFGMEYTF